MSLDRLRLNYVPSLLQLEVVGELGSLFILRLVKSGLKNMIHCFIFYAETWMSLLLLFVIVLHSCL